MIAIVDGLDTGVKGTAAASDADPAGPDPVPVPAPAPKKRGGGPKTAEGKDRSRRNALRDGRTGP